jgi:hypothetical protein
LYADLLGAQRAAQLTLRNRLRVVLATRPQHDVDTVDCSGEPKLRRVRADGEPVSTPTSRVFPLIENRKGTVCSRP